MSVAEELGDRLGAAVEELARAAASDATASKEDSCSGMSEYSAIQRAKKEITKVVKEIMGEE